MVTEFPGKLFAQNGIYNVQIQTNLSHGYCPREVFINTPFDKYFMRYISKHYTRVTDNFATKYMAVATYNFVFKSVYIAQFRCCFSFLCDRI